MNFRTALWGPCVISWAPVGSNITPQRSAETHALDSELLWTPQRGSQLWKLGVSTAVSAPTFAVRPYARVQVWHAEVCLYERRLFSATFKNRTAFLQEQTAWWWDLGPGSLKSFLKMGLAYLLEKCTHSLEPGSCLPKETKQPKRMPLKTPWLDTCYVRKSRASIFEWIF